MQFSSQSEYQQEKEKLEKMASEKKVPLELAQNSIIVPRYEEKLYKPNKGEVTCKKKKIDYMKDTRLYERYTSHDLTAFVATFAPMLMIAC